MRRFRHLLSRLELTYLRSHMSPESQTQVASHIGATSTLGARWALPVSEVEPASVKDSRFAISLRWGFGVMERSWARSWLSTML